MEPPEKPSYEDIHEEYIVSDFFNNIKRDKPINGSEIYVDIMFIQLESICSHDIKEKWRDYFEKLVEYCRYR